MDRAIENEIVSVIQAVSLNAQDGRAGKLKALEIDYYAPETENANTPFPPSHAPAVVPQSTST